MRFAYLDDSGLGDIGVEPYVIVAGVLVNADKQIKPVERHLNEIRNEFFAGNPPNGAVFHGVDIYHGNKHFSKHHFSFDSRIDLLTRLAEIPKTFDLPVVMGIVDRRTRTADNRNAELPDAIRLASAQCVMSIEKYMKFQKEEENCLLIYENSDTYKKVIKQQHEHFRSQSSRDKYGPSFPLERIVETALFEEKSESAMLQVADSVAYTLNRNFRSLGGESDYPLMKGLIALCSKLVEPPDQLLDGSLPGVKVVQVYSGRKD